MAKSYAVHVIGRIDLRYYLILTNKRYYVVDYSDPARISNYLIGSFSNIGTEWRVYDVTGFENQLTLKKPPFILRYFVEIVTTIQIAFIFNAVFFPDKLNISVLTQSTQIFDCFHMILMIIFSGLVLVALILNVKAPPKLKFENYKKYMLRQTNKKHNTKKIIGYAYFVAGLVSFLLLAIIGLNYGSLFVFGFLCIYTLIFERFIRIRIGEPRKKYQIVEGEEKK